jgi:hypothetical protein
MKNLRHSTKTVNHSIYSDPDPDPIFSGTDPEIRHQNGRDPQHCFIHCCGTHFLQCVTANLFSLFFPCLGIALLDMNIFSIHVFSWRYLRNSCYILPKFVSLRPEKEKLFAICTLYVLIFYNTENPRDKMN